MGSHGDVGISVGTEGVVLQTPSWTPTNARRRWGPATGKDWGGEGTSHPVLSSGSPRPCSAGKGLVPGGSKRASPPGQQPKRGDGTDRSPDSALCSPPALSHAHKLTDPVPAKGQEYEAGCRVPPLQRS